MNLRSLTTTDLQSVPFGHSGTPPNHGAGDGTRTRNLLITNQLLCQLSYASRRRFAFTHSFCAWQAKKRGKVDFFCFFAAAGKKREPRRRIPSFCRNRYILMCRSRSVYGRILTIYACSGRRKVRAAVRRSSAVTARVFSICVRVKSSGRPVMVRLAASELRLPRLWLSR